MTSGNFRIIITTEIGPRIIGGFVGNNPHNIFNVDPELAGKKGGEKWVNYGGHRLWHSPEDKIRSYMPDNSPIDVSVDEDGCVSFIQDEPALTGIRKIITIAAIDNNCFAVSHTLQNNNLWPIVCAPWAISVMAKGGIAIVPNNKATEGLLPTKFFAVWPYTKLNDPRITWGQKFILVKQDASPRIKPLKIGINCEEGWISYLNNGIAFTKMMAYDINDVYPDNNCNIEVYTCKDMLEAETLGALQEIPSGDAITHNEVWNAFETSKTIQSEKDVSAVFKDTLKI